MTKTKDYLELAEGLKNTNVPEVAELAKAYIELEKKYFDVVSSYIMLKHEKTFQALVDAGD